MDKWPAASFLGSIFTATLYRIFHTTTNRYQNKKEIILRGNIATRRSFTENLILLQNESYPCLTELVLQYVEQSHLPEPEKEFPFAGKITRQPKAIQLCSYLFRTLLLLFKTKVENVATRNKNKQDIWGVSFTANPWHKAILAQGTKVLNPSNHWFADPFVVTWENKIICFVEDYYNKHSKAHISAIEILDEKNYRILGPVITEPFHMSFPFIFEYQQELYMIPETSQAKAIRLYKCIDFPLKWEFQEELLSNVVSATLSTCRQDQRGQLLLETFHGSRAS